MGGTGAKLPEANPVAPGSTVLAAAPKAPEAQPPKAKSGRILVETKPEGATVYIDGEERGEAGEWLTLPVGKEVELELRHKGYRTIVQSVEVAEGSQKLFFSLEKGAVPKAKRRPKRRRPAVAKAKAEPETQAEPAAAEPAVVESEKEPAPTPPPEAKEPGFVSINARPWGEVHVDGRKVADQTPLLGHKLKPGKHRVRIYFVTLQKMSEERTITVAPGKTQTVFFKQ